MSTWRRKAIEAVSEEKALIEKVDNPMSLWIELLIAFENFVKNNEDEKIRKVLNYAAWCVSPNSGHLPNDISTAVVCAFYEHIGSNSSMWPHFKDWFSTQEFEKIKDCFKYHLSDKEFEEFNEFYYKSKQHN